MAVTELTLGLQQALTLRVWDIEDAATRVLVSRWARAWQEIADEWDQAVTQITAARSAGEPLTPTQILRLERSQNALRVTAEKLSELTDDMGAVLSGPARQIVADTIAQTAEVLDSQLPPGMSASFTRVDSSAVQAIVERTLSQITSLAEPLSNSAYAAVQTSLIRAVPSGWSPDQAAREMLKRTQGAFNGGLSRALTIARTELADAHHTAGQAFEQANADVMAGWTWVATLSSRTCIACLSMHGTEHATSEQMLSHQNCRCTRAPRSKTWREMGFDIDEPPSLLPEAEAWFQDLPEAEQIDIMGPKRWLLYQQGDATWADMNTIRHNDGWRDSITVTPLNQLGD